MNTKDILLLGDICPDNNFRALFSNGDTGPFSQELAAYIGLFPEVVANLECPATDQNRRIVKTGPNIKAIPQDIALLKSSGIKNLSLANNHILDYGSRGLADTLKACEENNVAFFGAGHNSREANTPLILEADNIKVGFLAYAEEEFNLADDHNPGAAHFDPYASLEQIYRLKEKVDRVVVLYHGGIEHYRYPSPELQKKCRAMVRFGADLVLCQHSHCIGTLERYDGSNILYGQGNTAFGYRKGDHTWNEGLAVAYNPEANTVGLRLLKASPQGVTLASPEEEEKRLEEFRRESERCADSEWLERSWLEFCEGMKALDLPHLYGKSILFNRLNRILGNRLIRILYSKRKLMITMEIIRCEAHHEVIRTILEDEIAIHPLSDKKCQKYR